jgi:protein-tyrosine phosphatase
VAGVEPVFVDCHTHVCPSGDDGAQNVGEGVALCRQAARRGTRLIFATPHVWPELHLTAEREEQLRAAFAELAPQAGLELRLGYELTPDEHLLDEDPRRYELDGTGCVLIEVPFSGDTDILWLCCEHIEEAGLTPLIAHPERTEAIRSDPLETHRLAERGWLIQVNATSLTGQHGPTIKELAWRYVDAGIVSVVASDGHRLARPPFLDEAYALAEKRVGERALELFDGSAVGLATTLRRPASRAASPGA